MATHREPEHFLVVLDAAGWTGADLRLVAALAGAQLEVRRAGGEIRLREPPSELRALLDLLGLAEVFVDQV